MYINGTLIKIKLAIKWHCFHKCTHLIGNWEMTILFKKKKIDVKNHRDLESI